MRLLVTYAYRARQEIKFKLRRLHKQAKDIDPESPDPPIGYGNIYFQQGKFHLAIDHRARGAAPDAALPTEQG